MIIRSFCFKMYQMHSIDSLLGKKNRRLLEQDEKSHWVFHHMLPMAPTNQILKASVILTNQICWRVDLYEKMQ